MARIRTQSLPDDALLGRYRGASPGETMAPYTDCFVTLRKDVIALEQFVFAFYTTWVFKLERLILRFAVSMPSTDEDALAVAKGSIDQFAAWIVEDRTATQLLMCDYRKRTRSWFKVSPAHDGRTTTLFFGSAVIPRRHPKTGVLGVGIAFGLLIAFHRIYSRILLRSAVSRMDRITRAARR